MLKKVLSKVSVVLTALFLCTLFAAVNPADVKAESKQISGLYNTSKLSDGDVVLLMGDTTINIDKNVEINTIISASVGIQLKITGDSDKTLTCDNINIGLNNKVTVTIDSGNLVTNEYFNVGDLEINGGTLKATGLGANGIYACRLTIRGGNVTATSVEKGETEGNCGISITGAGGEAYLNITGGNIEASGVKVGIYSSSGNISISGTNTTVKASSGSDQSGIIAENGTVTIASPLEIITPVGGGISSDGHFIATTAGGEDAAREVEIKALEYSVEATGDGHGKASADPSKAVGGTEIALSAESDKGYAFDKWTSENEVTFADPGSPDTTFSMPLENVKVKANFKPVCTVTFDGNGGIGTMSAQVVDKGSAAKLNKNAFTCDGYIFTNWNTKSDGSGTSYADEADITTDTDLTLYAQWTEYKPDPPVEKEYAVTVTASPAGSGTATASVKSGKTGTKVIITATADNGFRFREWQVISGGVELADSKSPETTFSIKNSDVEVRAVFEEKEADTYTVTVSNDGHGSAKAKPISGQTGTKVTLTAVSKAGYKFKKWKVISGGVTLADAAKAKTTFVIKDASVKVKAIFEKVYDAPQPELEPVDDDKILLSWQKVDGAKGYDIFMSRDNKGVIPKLVKTIEGNKTFEWTATGLKPRKSYKALVKAYVKDKKGKKQYISESPLMHVYTAGGNKTYTNAKSIKLNTSDGKIKKGKLTLKVKDTYKIKASVKKADRKKKLMPASHVKTLRYRSSDPGVATIGSSGKITAKKKGKCNIYVYAHNGVSKTIKLTVK